MPTLKSRDSFPRCDTVSTMIPSIFYLCLLSGASAVRVLQVPPSLTLQEGQTANMSCIIEETQSVRMLQYYWYRNETREITKIQNNSRVSITSSSNLRSSSLLISSLTLGDAGLYVCQIAIKNKHVQNKSTGKGTQLNVTGSTPSSYVYLFGLLFLIPVCFVVLIFWRRQRKIRGNRLKAAEQQGRNKGVRNLGSQDRDGDSELHYASIFPASRDPKAQHPRKQVKEEESTEYAAVRVTNTPQCSPVGRGQDGEEPYVCYATLRTSPSQININDPGRTGRDHQEPETTYADVRVH